MSTPAEQLQETLESVDTTEEVNHALMMGEAYERLKVNPDFKTIILEGYLNEKVLASVSLLAVPAIKARGERPEVMEDLVSASNLQFFFQMIEQAYEGAKSGPVLSDEEEDELNAAEG